MAIKEIENSGNGQKSLEEIEEMLGIEPTTIEEEGSGLEYPVGFKRLTAQNFEHGTEVMGRALLSKPFKTTFTDKNTNETTESYKIELCLIDDDEEEYFVHRIPVPGLDETVKNVRRGSGLYDFIYGLTNMISPDVLKGTNALGTIHLDKIIKVVESYDGTDGNYLNIKLIADEFNKDGRIITFYKILPCSQ